MKRFIFVVRVAGTILLSLATCSVAGGTGRKETELFHAVSSGNFEKVRQLIVEDKVSVDSTNEFGESSLHLSAISNKKSNGKILELLIQHGADVNKRTDYQYDGHATKVTRTPLHWYIYSCDFEAAKTLVAHGADPMIKTEEGETSLEIVRKLVEKQPSEARECVKILDMFEKVIMEGQTRSDAL